jgi:hypothetical protein
MARNPAERYQNARDFKTDLDNPAAVQITGRVNRLVVPSVIAAKSRMMVLYVMCALVPVMAFLGFWLYKHVQLK